jgi:TetR/AcrR family transcriptional regulator, cholesterol catabolism regulator
LFADEMRAMVQTQEKARGARRDDLVREAARLFSARGYHGTSMQHLADALGLLRGSLYAHIGSKEDLLFDVVDDGAERFLARGRAALDAPTATERLRRFMVEHVETAIEHLDAGTVFLNEWRYLSDERRSIIQAKRDEYEAMLTSVIEAGIASGEFRANVDVRFAVLLVLSAGNWVYEWYRPGGALGPTQIGDRFAELIVTGLKEDRSDL